MFWIEYKNISNFVSELLSLLKNLNMASRAEAKDRCLMYYFNHIHQQSVYI